MSRLRTRPRWIGGLLAIGLAVGLGSGIGASPVGAESSPSPGSTHPYLVKIHADWCGTCIRLMPLWNRLGEEYGDSVRAVVFDVTDRKAVEQSLREAARLGLGEFFDAHKSKTGTIAVLDPTTREPVAVFRGEMDFARYQTVLGRGRDQGGA